MNTIRNGVGIFSAQSDWVSAYYGNSFTQRINSENKFVKQAHKAKEALPDMITEVTELRQQSVTLLHEIDELDVDRLDDYIEKYNKLVGRKKDVNQEISVAMAAIEGNNSKIQVFKK